MNTKDYMVTFVHLEKDDWVMDQAVFTVDLFREKDVPDVMEIVDFGVHFLLEVGIIEFGEIVCYLGMKEIGFEFDRGDTIFH